ncbi:MAG: ATP-binding cassette domain-containing protein [Flavobacteriales bacterium]|jgi:cell division transport system ATP-binding protein|nr:ATP-binding cassette domain-containing protein [Flavobacteriales bacterium]
MNNNNIIHLKNVTITQRELTILNNISLDIERGEFIYLIGKTGSGKSSLLKALYAENKIKSGVAEVARQSLINIKKKSILELRRKLGIIFQDFQLLTDRSIADNLLFVMKATGWKDKNKIKNKIDELLKKVGMENKGYKFPHQISGGEQQRIAIARALINNPELIIADEPTGNLDPETTNEIMKILFEISSNGKAVIMATHDYDMMQKFPSRTFRCANEDISEINLAQAPEFLTS